MYHRVVFLLLAYTSIAWLLACHEGTAKQKEQAMNAYSSPNAVFDAYRQAGRSGDWRTFYFLFTPKAQRDMVFEAEFVCGEAGGRKFKSLKAVQAKFGASEAAVGKRYLEEYKKKHGHADVIDKFLAKAIPYWESKDKGTGGAETGQAGTTQPPPESEVMDALPRDEELFRQALYDATKDKVSFFAEVQKIVGKGRKPNIIGDLEQVTINGDTAIGRAKITIVPTPGETPPKSGGSRPPYDKPFKFRLVDGGWLLDSL